MRLAKFSGKAPPPKQLARMAKLKYVSDEEPGFTRRANGHGFVYLKSSGSKLADERALRRIEELVIPPAWQDVWICRFATGHLQVTGRDDRRRKQYIYHERWREAADLLKFVRLAEFGRQLPRLRRRVAAELRGRKLTRPRLLAGLIALLDATSLRIGSEEYVTENGSYGLTTLRNRHVKEQGSGRELRFTGKGGLKRKVLVSDAPLVRLIDDCRALTGGKLFQYQDEERGPVAVDAADVNEHLQELTGGPFTAKDFRTWKASAHVAAFLHAHRGLSAAKRKRTLVEAACLAADALGNTPAVCKKSYIHPGLFESYRAGAFDKFFAGWNPRQQAGLTRDEQIFRRFLKRWVASR